MSFQCYYKVGLNGPVCEFTDDYNYDVNDDSERESLFVMIAHHSYGYNHRLWDTKPSHEIFVCDKDGEPLLSMQVDMYMEPTFEAYER